MQSRRDANFVAKKKNKHTKLRRSDTKRQVWPGLISRLPFGQIGVFKKTRRGKIASRQNPPCPKQFKSIEKVLNFLFFNIFCVKLQEISMGTKKKNT